MNSSNKMSISRKTLIGGMIGLIFAVGLIIGGTYVFGGSSFLGGSSTPHSTNTSFLSTLTTQQGASTSTRGAASTITTAVGSSSALNSASTIGGSSSGTLQISMIDPPVVPANVVDVYVNYTAIQVHIADGGNNSGWFNVTSSGSINLTGIISNSKLLASAKLPNGTYNLVRFNVTSAVVTVNSTGKLVNYTAQVPSGKVQATINGGVSVQQNSVSALLIDISPRVTDANGNYTLIPSANADPQAPVTPNASTNSTSQTQSGTSVTVTKTTRTTHTSA